tara:strand:+ start:2149 stop:2766 length:618 start_codon:yes stop_codon:yes gene_type:complete
LNILKNSSQIIFCFLFITIIPPKLNAFEQSQSVSLKIENFFKKLETLEADFIQVSPSGDVSSGKVFLDLPGKLRIDYEKPNNLLITSKGSWIVIQDRDSKSTNNIPLKSSPFSMLLKNKFILKSKNLNTEYNVSSGIVSLKIKSYDNEKPESLILEFSENPFSLKKWIIIDTFGESTTVLIQNAKYNMKLSHLLFFPIDFPEPNF